MLSAERAGLQRPYDSLMLSNPFPFGVLSCPGAISVFGKLAGDMEETWEALLGPKFRPRQPPLALVNPFLQRKTPFP